MGKRGSFTNYNIHNGKYSSFQFKVSGKSHQISLPNKVEQRQESDETGILCRLNYYYDVQKLLIFIWIYLLICPFCGWIIPFGRYPEGIIEIRMKLWY